MIDIAHNDLAESISPRHREWGNDCPATNIDCILAEYNHKQPVAFIEYKGRRPMLSDSSSANAQVMINLGDRANLPNYIVYYNNSDWTFSIAPGNKLSRDLLFKYADFQFNQTIDELRFVGFLYALRQERLPASIANKLNRFTEEAPHDQTDRLQM